MFASICAWINGGANNLEAGDLRRHRAIMTYCNEFLRYLLYFRRPFYHRFFTCNSYSMISFHCLEFCEVINTTFHKPWCCDTLFRKWWEGTDLHKSVYLSKVKWKRNRFSATGQESMYVSESLHWRHNERDGVSNHQPHDCLLNRLFTRRSKKTSKLRLTGLCEGNSQVTGEFPAQRASNAENASIWWRHHGSRINGDCVIGLSLETHGIDTL